MSAWCSSTLVGMQPTCRQVPPRYGSFSTTTVFSPSSPARIAATYPPGPLPIIATSYFATRSLPSAAARTGDRIWRSDCRRTSATLEETREVRPKKAGARRSSSERQNRHPFYERHAKRTKSRPRLRRRRLRPGKQEILTVVRPPRNLLRRSCFGLFYSLPHSPAWPRKALSMQAKIRRIFFSREWQRGISTAWHRVTSSVLLVYLE